jgi:membrane protein DedA with SNARE-associated domain
MPAFPHSLINYSSGILKVKMSHFILAAVIGNAIKSYIFSGVIYQAVSSASVMDLVSIKILAPLVLLSVVVLVVALLKARAESRNI